MSRRSPVQHNVNTKHPRYQISKYIRGHGQRSQRSSPVQLFQTYPDEPRNFFGTTNDPNQALWIMPDGRMISGSKDNVNPWSDYEHQDVVRAYGLEPSDRLTREWMKVTGAIRMRRTSMAPDATLNLEFFQQPNTSQMRTISRAVNREGSIYVDYWDMDGKPIVSQRVKHAGQLKGLLTGVEIDKMYDLR